MGKIVVFGMGYVGLSNAILLAQNNEVIGIEILENKLEMLKNKKSPIIDKEIEDFLMNKNLNLTFSNNAEAFLKDSDFAVIATPTNFIEDKNYFDTSSVENVIEQISKINLNVTVIIKSTIPIGFMQSMTAKYPGMKLLFSPEFLREGQALHDNLYPSRIIVGYDSSSEEIKQKANEFANLLLEGSMEKNAPIFLMDYKEAECVKLFANTYLAMRVAYFNELDNFAIEQNLNTKNIIDGICSDPRIGNQYNNPSFGYGGYCFPKDTKQLFANYTKEMIPNKLIRAIVESNTVRKEAIANDLIAKTKLSDEIGIYRLIMKAGSDNCRSSAIIDVIKILSNERHVIIYEPTIEKIDIPNCVIVNDLQAFKNMAEIIVANRIDKNLDDVKEKVYTRDIFNRD